MSVRAKLRCIAVLKHHFVEATVALGGDREGHSTERSFFFRDRDWFEDWYSVYRDIFPHIFYSWLKRAKTVTHYITLREYITYNIPIHDYIGHTFLTSVRNEWPI